MAYFIRATGSSLTPVEHEKKLFKEYLKSAELTGMSGKPGSNAVIIYDDTYMAGAKAGDTKRYHFVPQNDTDGIYGQNATITGNEEGLDEYYMDVKLDEVNKPFAKKGNLTDQRVIFGIRDEFYSQLKNWYEKRHDVWCYDAMTGYISDGFDYAAGLDLSSGYELATATNDLVNGAGRCIRSTGTGFALVAAASSDATALNAAMTNACKMNLSLIRELSIVAKTAGTYRIQPVKLVDGREYFILLCDLRAYRDLKADTDIKSYMLGQVQGGKLANDPIATGDVTVIDNIIIKPCERIRRFASSTSNEYYARNLLVGANALAVLWGKTLDYVEQEIDYNRVMGVNGSEIRGQKKFQFNGVDIGVAQVITAAN